VLAWEGRLDEAIAEGKRAAELDPLSPLVRLDNSIAFVFAGKYQAAMDEVKMAADLNPAFATDYGMSGSVAEKIRNMLPQYVAAKAMEPYSTVDKQTVRALLAYAYGASGDRTRALSEFEELKKTTVRGRVLPFNLAVAYIGLGDREHAIDCLERAHASDSMMLLWLKECRVFDPLRSEPRFVALMKKLRFVQ
jgi:tetratricopeptide (TPR) repeat protein